MFVCLPVYSLFPWFANQVRLVQREVWYEWFTPVHVLHRERERERDRQTDRERETDRERRDVKWGWGGGGWGEGQRDRNRDRHAGCFSLSLSLSHTHTHTHRGFGPSSYSSYIQLHIMRESLHTMYFTYRTGYW